MGFDRSITQLAREHGLMTAAEAHVDALLQAMRRWGAEEDGVPDGDSVIGAAYNAADKWLERAVAPAVCNRMSIQCCLNCARFECCDNTTPQEETR